MINLNTAIPPVDLELKAAENLFNLIALLVDPAATKERVERYIGVETAAREALAALAAAETLARERLANIEAKIAAERAEHDAALRDSQQKFDARRLQQENALAAREARLAERESQVAADADANAALAADLERRIGLLRAASAA
jgi:hypothetical protein